MSKLWRGDPKSVFVFIKGHFPSLPWLCFPTALHTNHPLLLAAEAALLCAVWGNEVPCPRGARKWLFGKLRVSAPLSPSVCWYMDLSQQLSTYNAVFLHFIRCFEVLMGAAVKTDFHLKY